MPQSNRTTSGRSHSWRPQSSRLRRDIAKNGPGSTLETILGAPPVSKAEARSGRGGAAEMRPDPNLPAMGLVDPVVSAQHSPIEPSPNSTARLWRIMEEVRGLSPEHQILLRDRINWWLRQTHPQTAPALNDNTRRETIRRAKGSMAGLMPTTAEFLAEKHTKLEQEERNLGAPFDQRSEGGK
jgi:hypothetical protein